MVLVAVVFASKYHVYLAKVTVASFGDYRGLIFVLQDDF
jgi:hypothetical protein